MAGESEAATFVTALYVTFVTIDFLGGRNGNVKKIRLGARGVQSQVFA